MRARLDQAFDVLPRRVIAGAFTLRLRVIVRRETLDRQLAEGADQHTNRELGIRAAQLCKARARRVIARRLRRTLGAAGKPAPRRWGFRPLTRDQILADSDALTDLVRRLEAPGPVEPMGAALARLLLTEPASPLRVQSEPGTLYTFARLATAAMGASAERADPAPRT